MNTEKAKVRQVMGGIFIDLFTEDLKEIQEAVYLYGGRIVVYELLADEWRISYSLDGFPFSMMIYGINITKEQFDLQIKAFGGQVKQFEKGTKLTFIDNLYFVL